MNSPVEEEVEILKQRSNSSSQESQAGCLNMNDATEKKPFKKRQLSMPEEVNTQELPGSDFMLPKRKEERS
jgi:hypothetical protein